MNNKNLLKAENYLLATFPTTHSALHAEKVLEQSDIPFLVVPTPREVSSGCGLAIRFFNGNFSECLQTFKANSVLFSNIYKADKGNFRTVIPGGDCN